MYKDVNFTHKEPIAQEFNKTRPLFVGKVIGSSLGITLRHNLKR